MMRNTTRQSGTYKLPPTLAYPTLLPLALTPEINGVLCYVIKHYGTDGIAVSINRQKADGDIDISMAFSDWRGNKIDISDKTQQSLAVSYFYDKYLKIFIDAMRIINMQFAQYYMVVGNDDLILTDIRLGQYKLTGPGMVRDIFNKLIRTQEVIKIELIDDKALTAIERGFGSYAGNLILKPSKFRTVERPELGTCPLYVEVRR